MNRFAGSRLRRRIASGVLAAIVTAELLILIPSANRFRADAIERAEAEARAGLYAAIDARRFDRDAPMSADGLRRAAEYAMAHTPLKGGELRFDDGRTIAFGAFARGPETRDDAEIVRIWPGADDGVRYDATAVVDIAPVQDALAACLLRNAAIVLLLSVVATAAALAAIHILILRRLTALQQRLSAAADDPMHPERYIAAVQSRDEVDDLAAAAHALLARNAQQIQRLEYFQAELEERVEMRTAALSATTERMKAQMAEREAAEERMIELSAFVSEHPEPAMRIGADNRVVYANPAARRILETMDQQIGGLAPRPWADALQATRCGGGDTPLIRERIGERSFNLRFALAADGGTVNVYGRDVTIETRAQAYAVRAATHDPLTNLPNRTMFMTQLAATLAQAERRHVGVVVFTIGLKAFAEVNDRIGFDGGDLTLRAVGERLREIARDEDGVARVGGDEFGIVASGVPHVEAAAGAVARFAAAFEAPFMVDGRGIALSAAIGVSFIPGDQVGNAETALRQSGQAMLRAKEGAATTSAFFDPRLDAEAEEARRIAQLIRDALDNDGFDLRYQPKISVCDGRLIGAEALIRLRRRDGFDVGPERFIPIAERTGLIRAIGRWALFESARTFAAAHRDFGLRTPVSVNLSPRQFNDDDVPDMVGEVLADTGLPPEMLELEITETAVMQNIEHTVAALTALANRGVAISIDDFGTGQSSLSQLRRLPADKVKLDRSFVTDIETDRNAEAIARAVVGLARGLGKTTVAEGVETLGQFRRLRAMGIDEAQGYLFAQPAVREDFLARARAPEPYMGVSIAA